MVLANPLGACDQRLGKRDASAHTRALMFASDQPRSHSQSGQGQGEACQVCAQLFDHSCMCVGRWAHLSHKLCVDETAVCVFRCHHHMAIQLRISVERGQEHLHGHACA